jgi:hypothetical protein
MLILLVSMLILLDLALSLKFKLEPRKCVCVNYRWCVSLFIYKPLDLKLKKQQTIVICR